MCPLHGGDKGDNLSDDPTGVITALILQEALFECFGLPMTAAQITTTSRSETENQGINISSPALITLSDLAICHQTDGN